MIFIYGAVPVGNAVSSMEWIYRPDDGPTLFEV